MMQILMLLVIMEINPKCFQLGDIKDVGFEKDSKLWLGFKGKLGKLVGGLMEIVKLNWSIVC